MNREFERQQDRQRRERDPKAKNRLMIASGVVFLLFALWIMFSTKNYSSLEFPLVSDRVEISMKEDEVTLDADESKKFSRRMQNCVRTEDHDAFDESLTITLGTGVTLTLDPEKNAGTIAYRGETKSIRVDGRLIKEAKNYLAEKKVKDEN